MTLHSKIILIFLLLANLTGWAKGYPVDSVGNEKKDGKTFILHRVEGGQTLYAVMRKYKTTIQALKEANPGMADNLATGQTIRVPHTVKPSTVKPKVTVAQTEIPKVEPPKAPPVEAPVIVKPAVSGIYKVEEGQNLYRVALLNGVSMADVRRWNGLLQDGVTAGQELIVSEAAFKLSGKTTATPPVLKVDSAKVTVLETAKPKEISKKTVEKPLPKPNEDEADVPNRPTKASMSGKRLVESGVAEVIDANDTSNKYLALHRSASVGTLLQVKNVSTGVGIWVKVIGKLPEIGANDRILIKLSARAQEKLSPGNRRFMVEVNYLSE